MTTNVLDRVDEKGSILGATFMVAGTCIGGGMLAMPVQAAQAGFGISVLVILLCWAFMTFTGLLLVEATLWIKNEAHFTSLSRILVGTPLKIIAMIIYLFMNYVSLVAYTAGGSALINIWTEALFGFPIGYATGCVIFVLFFGIAVALGLHFVGKFNSWLMIALGISLITLISFGVNSIDLKNLEFRPAWIESLSTFSLILATFSFQMIVPSICSYMKYDTVRLPKAIIAGTTLSMTVYLIWVLVVHGIVPWEGENGLKETLALGASATLPLRSRLQHFLLTVVADLFAFLAVGTSFLGLSMALFHFLGDCFKEIKIDMSKNLIILLTMVPTTFLAILFPRALLQFLDLSGGFGDTTLSALIPILMVWAGRYWKNQKGEYQVPGGKVALVAAAAFFFSLLLLQIYHLC